MNIPPIPHPAFAKIPRLNRDIVITEKIDGTNGLIHVTETGEVCAGSRNRWITPAADNFGFAKWVDANAQELQKLGPGNHYGEYWGQGIQDGYDLKEKRFSLFNVDRWEERFSPFLADGELKNPGIREKQNPENFIRCCYVVPTIYIGSFSQLIIQQILSNLREFGSRAAAGYMKPEGIVVFHTASRKLYKVTIENDECSKSTNTAPWRPGWGPEPK